MIRRNYLFILLLFLLILIVLLTVAVFTINFPSKNKYVSDNNLLGGEQLLTVSDDKYTVKQLVKLKEVIKDDQDRVYAFVESYNNAEKKKLDTVSLIYDTTKFKEFFIHRLNFKNPEKIYEELITYKTEKEIYDGLSKYKNKIIKLSIVLKVPEGKTKLLKLSDNIECNKRYYEIVSKASNEKLECQPFFAEIYVYDK